MPSNNRKYNKTFKILTEIKNRIKNKYNIIDLDLYKDSENIVYSKLSFKLATPYYDVPIEVSRNYNVKDGIYIAFKFKNARRQRRSGITTGYALSIYHSIGGDKSDYIEKIDFDRIFFEMDNILENIKKDGTWCDESRYDD